MEITLTHKHTHKKIKNTHRHTYKKIKKMKMIGKHDHEVGLISNSYFD